MGQDNSPIAPLAEEQVAAAPSAAAGSQDALVTASEPSPASAHAAGTAPEAPRATRTPARLGRPRHATRAPGVGGRLANVARSYVRSVTGLSATSKIILFLYVALGAFTALLGTHVVRTAWFYDGNYEQNYFVGLAPVDTVGFLALFAAVALVTTVALFAMRALYERIPLRRKSANPTAVFLVCWLAIFACWLPYFFANYPGSLYADSIVTIRQALGINVVSDHHPLAYTAFVAACLRLGDAVAGSYVAGIAIYTVVQMLIVSGSFACLCSWLAKKRVPLPAIVVLCALLCIASVFPLHAVSMWKDALYASFMLLFALAAFDCAASKGTLLERRGFLFRLGALGLLVCLSRTNGVYTMAATWIAMLVAMRLDWRLVVCAATSLALYFGGTAVALSAVEVRTEPVESYGIVLQQAAAVVVYDGEMTDEQREFMDALLPLDQYADEYLPCSVDGIKWADDFNTEFFDEHQSEFMRTWLEMGRANLSIYARAYIMESYEYWTFGDVNRNIHVNYVNDKYDAPDLDIAERNLIEEMFGEDVAALFPFRFVSLGEGATSWLVLFALLLLAIARRERWSRAYEAPLCLAFAPALFSWGTVLLSSPFAALPRYVLPATFLLGLIALLPWAAEGALVQFAPIAERPTEAANATPSVADVVELDGMQPTS